MERGGRVWRVQPGVPRRDESRFKAGKSVEDAVAAFKMPDKFKDYDMNGVKDNVTKIYAELKK